MRAIYKRELKSFFQNVTGWLFVAVMIAVFGLYYFVYCYQYGYPYISYVLSGINFVFLITIPVLTMRILAEDRKNKTDQLTLTAPVSVFQIVLGKYLAMVTIYLIPVAVVLLSSLALGFFGTVPKGENLAAVIGYFLYGICTMAIGMFISSLTESQVIAAVVSFGALFLGFMMNNICSLISEQGNVVTTILGSYDFVHHIENFYNGFFDIKGLVYFLSLTVLALFLTVQSIQKRRWNMTKANLKRGFLGTGFLVVVAALVVVVNLLVGELPESRTSFDWTTEKLYTMADSTKKALDLLEDDVKIYVIDDEENADKVLDRTLTMFADSSSHISVEYKDPAVSPTFYKTYTDSIVRNSLIVESAKRFRVISYNDVYVSEFDYSTYQYNTTGYDAEGQLMSAIAYVTNDDMPVIYNITGHNEPAIDASFADAIEKANMTLTDLNLLKAEVVPEDAYAVIINAPTSDLSDDDTLKLMSYLANGGRAIINAGYTEKELKNFNSILEHYQITLHHGMVVESDTDHYYQTPFYLLPDIEHSPETSDLTDTYVFVPYAMGMSYPADEVREGLIITPLLSTSEEALVKSNVESMNTYDYEDGDIEGPFKLGLKVEDTKEASLIYVFSSNYLFTDSADSMVSGANLSLFKGTLAQFGGDNATSIVPAKSYAPLNITVSRTVAIVVAALMIAIIPIILLVSGIVIWAKRRKR